MTNFKQLKLLPTLLETIIKQGYDAPTPIQAQSVPFLLRGKDLLGIAQTGTGKTAAFAWPTINKFAKNKVKMRSRHIRALILTPTRELASQINSSFRTYSSGLKLFSGVIFGGVGKKGQITMLSKGCDILIATPGRLVDLMNEDFVKFDQLEVFILDEADRMLDMGFSRDVNKIISKLPSKKQTMLFSATMPQEVAKLGNSLLNNPVKVEVTPESSTVDLIDQKVYMIDQVNKLKLLKELLKSEPKMSSLVFTRTKHGADRVMRELTKVNIKAVAIHGNKSQGNRENALKQFKNEKAEVLIATDIAARGIDINHVSHVFNYNLPEDAESYVHRIGRTARAGRKGVAISFCDATEVKFLKSIQKFIKINIPVFKNHEFHRDFTSAMIKEEEKRKLEAKEKRIQERRAHKSKSKSRNSKQSKPNSPNSKKNKSKKSTTKKTKKNSKKVTRSKKTKKRRSS